ncbi:MAG: hypothetical protein FWC41_03080 [Firmicutes bacterium]|nr:hypothetical protein [Bacillota bacterium]
MKKIFATILMFIFVNSMVKSDKIGIFNEINTWVNIGSAVGKKMLNIAKKTMYTFTNVICPLLILADRKEVRDEIVDRVFRNYQINHEYRNLLVSLRIVGPNIVEPDNEVREIIPKPEPSRNGNPIIVYMGHTLSEKSFSRDLSYDKFVEFYNDQPKNGPHNIFAEQSWISFQTLYNKKEKNKELHDKFKYYLKENPTEKIILITKLVKAKNNLDGLDDIYGIHFVALKERPDFERTYFRGYYVFTIRELYRLNNEILPMEIVTILDKIKSSKGNIELLKIDDATFDKLFDIEENGTIKFPHVRSTISFAMEIIDIDGTHRIRGGVNDLY